MARGAENAFIGREIFTDVALEMMRKFIKGVFGGSIALGFCETGRRAANVYWLPGRIKMCRFSIDLRLAVTQGRVVQVWLNLLEAEPMPFPWFGHV